MSSTLAFASSGTAPKSPYEICFPLAESFSNLGFEIIDDVKYAQYLLSFNHNSAKYYQFINSGGMKSKSVLLRFEPRAVFPSQYRSSTENLYGHIITFGDNSSSGDKRFPWPYYFNENPLDPEKWAPEREDEISRIVSNFDCRLENWKGRNILVSLIASNKVSPVRNNNYALRRKLALEIPESSLQVFGYLWDSSIHEKIRHRLEVLRFSLRNRAAPNVIEIYGNLFRRYPASKGPIDDKHKIIRDSKFSLVIENDSNYVSEKLIDALLGGSIPIYIGGGFTEFEIPEVSVVSNLRTWEEIESYISNVLDSEIESKLLTTMEWLKSGNFTDLWFGDNVFDRVATVITRDYWKIIP